MSNEYNMYSRGNLESNICIEEICYEMLELNKLFMINQIIKSELIKKLRVPRFKNKNIATMFEPCLHIFKLFI